MDLGDFSWEVRPDGKVHFFMKKNGGSHWTLHPGPHSSAFDLHEASVNADVTKSYETLFMIKVEDVEKLVNEIGPVLVSGTLWQFRLLNLGWVRRRKITILRDPLRPKQNLPQLRTKARGKGCKLTLSSFRRRSKTQLLLTDFSLCLTARLD